MPRLSVCFAALLCCATFAASALLPSAAHAQVNVLTYHNDNGRTGQNLNETVLTPANVTANSFGKLYSRAVDGYVYAQPLYVSGVSIPGKGIHDVVYVATEHDTVYAFDAHSKAGDNALPLWQTSFLNPAAGVTTLPNGTGPGGYGLYPEIGITGTPVIDPATGTLYVVAFTKEVVAGVGHYYQRLHALDITTGQERAPFPTDPIVASTPGVGDGNVNGIVTFTAYNQLERAALVLNNGTIYIGESCRTGSRHGWIFAYGAVGSAQPAVQISNLCTSPNSSLSAMWGSGAGLAADTDGTVWTITGNGVFNGSTAGGKEWGEAVLKFSTAGGLSVADYFVPNTIATLNATDGDFGSGAVLLLPDAFGSTQHPHILVSCGKEGTIYVLDRDNLGKFGGAVNNIVQALPTAVSGAWSMAACWSSATSNYVYYSTGGNVGEAGDVLKAFAVSNGQLSTTPVAQASTSFQYPGATPSVSSNGTTNGIVWAVETDGFATNGPAVLHAYDAANVAAELYNSSQRGARDQAALACKFAVPTIANGNVYFCTASTLEVFGLISGSAPTVATAASASPSPVTGTTTDLSVLGADDDGEAGLVYTWSATGPAPVAFSANATNDAKNATATFTKAGNYTFTVTLADAGGLTKTSTVSVTVNQTITSLTVTPATVTLALNSTQPFTARKTDQFGTVLTLAAPVWSVDPNGTGTITPAGGLYTSGPTTGTAIVRATQGSLSGTAGITVSSTAPTVTAAAAATPNPVTGTTTALSVLGTDDGGETNLVYTWSATGPAPVTFSANATNDAKNTTATFAKAGNYTFTATLTDAYGMTTPSTMSVVVRQTAATLTVTPATASIQSGATQQFSTAGTDQFGTALSPAPAATWAVSGGGTIGSSGLYTAGAAAGGPFTVSAKSGGVTGTASVSVTAPAVVTLLPTADATVQDGAAADTNFGSTSTLTVSRAKAGTSTPGKQCAYLRFDLTNVKSAPNSALLTLIVNAASTPAGKTETVQAYAASNDKWTESGLTWNTAPSLNTTSFSSTASKIAAASVALTAGSTLTFNVTSYVAAHLGKVVTVQLMNTTADGYTLVMDSREGSQGPKLVLH